VNGSAVEIDAGGCEAGGHDQFVEWSGKGGTPLRVGLGWNVTYLGSEELSLVR
jgi:hypothetical protein